MSSASHAPIGARPRAPGAAPAVLLALSASGCVHPTAAPSTAVSSTAVSSTAVSSTAGSSGGLPGGSRAAVVVVDRPPGQERPVFEGDRPRPGVQGVWRSRGHGRLLAINAAEVRSFVELGARCWPVPTAGPTEMSQVAHRFTAATADPEVRVFTLLPDDTRVVFDRIPTLPGGCREPLPATPEETVAVFLGPLEAHYAFFDRRLPDGRAPRGAAAGRGRAGRE